MMGKCKRKKNRKITFGTSFSHLHQRVREARIVRRVLERPSFHFFLSSGFYHFSSPFIHFSLPSFLCFSFFFFFFPLLSVFVSSEPSVFFIYFVSMYLVSSEDLPAPPRVLQKKGRGARREARGEERKCNAGSCPTSRRICDTATSIAREFLLFSH